MEQLKTFKNTKTIAQSPALVASSRSVFLNMNMCMNSDYFRIETGKILFKIFWFVETTSGTLHEETIETHREIADAIASHDPLRAQNAMYLHLVYNRKRIQLSKTLNV